MKRSNTVPSPGARNGQPAAAPNDTTPKGRYKSVILTPRRGPPSSNSQLSPGYLHSFGFANTRSSSQPETSRTVEESTQQTVVSDIEDASELPSDSSLPPPPTSPPPPLPPPEDNIKNDNYFVLSESKLNVLSHNLSEIADRISPTKYEAVIEIDPESLETLMDKNLGPSSEIIVSNSEQPTRFKTPYCRQRRDSKTYVSKQKSFTRKRSYARGDTRPELNNNEEISVDASNVLTFPAGNVEAFKQDSESDSGYSSSMSTSVSLSEEIEAAKRLSLENGSCADIEADDLTCSGDDLVRKRSAGNPVINQRAADSPTLHQNTSNVRERLDSLIHGVSSGIVDLDLNSGGASEQDVHTRKAAMTNGLDGLSASFKLSQNENIQEKTAELPKSPFHLQKTPLDDSDLPRTKTGRRPGLLRRRTTLMSFRPPKQMTVQEGESDIVEMDEAGFLQMLTDLKTFKTLLLKLKRELQEADVVSPLTHSHSCLVRRGSLSIDTDPVERNPLHRKKMLLHRTMTMDAATMHQRLHRESSTSSTGGAVGNLNGITELTESFTLRKQIPQPNTGENEEMKNLREELEDMKEKVDEITQERNSLMIAREELEHELDSKNHTIRMLQKQLESQTDSQDEIAYLKRQVKSLTNQIQQQQQKITELRYRTSSPGPIPTGAQKKETVKADIRNRLRDAFVKHLGESSKSNVQLSKYIQKAEQSITMAQKGLSSLYSSPHASTEHLPKDKSRASLSSQSSVDRGQEDSDGRESESDSSKSSSNRRSLASSRGNRNNEDSGSESGESVRRRAGSLSTSRSHDESDGRAWDSDSGKSSRRRIASSLFNRSSGEEYRTDSELDSANIGPQTEETDTDKASKLSATIPRVRKLSRSKLLNKIEASPLSHSWTPGAIEKIVKTWRETRSVEEKSKEEEKALKPVSHVQFL